LSFAEFADLAITDSELEWLKETCPFLESPYLDYLSSFRFNPSQIQITFTPVSADGECGNVDIEASGPWVETIFWEVPLMACLSEIYFRVVKTDWSYVGQSGKQDFCKHDESFVKFFTQSLHTIKREYYSKQVVYLASLVLAGDGHSMSKTSLFNPSSVPQAMFMGKALYLAPAT
jgi:hypothetical protein